MSAGPVAGRKQRSGSLTMKVMPCDVTPCAAMCCAVLCCNLLCGEKKRYVT